MPTNELGIFFSGSINCKSRDASEHIRNMYRTYRPMVITQNGKPAAVVLTPDDFEALEYREFEKAKIKAGIESAATGPNHSPEELTRRVKAKLRKTPV